MERNYPYSGDSGGRGYLSDVSPSGSIPKWLPWQAENAGDKWQGIEAVMEMYHRHTQGW